jgi:hypothetical protein
MTRLEELITDTLAARAGEAPDTSRLLVRVRTGTETPRRSSWAVVGVAAAAVVTVVVGIATLTSGPPHQPAPTATSHKPVTAPPIPAGTQLVSYHGVQVFVPSSWKLEDTRCGTPMHDTAIVEDGSPILLCLVAAAPRGLTVVRVTALNTPSGRDRTAVATHPVTVDGHPARQGYGTPPGTPTPLSVLFLPDRGVVVSVESPSTHTADSILAHVQLADIDSYGCRGRVSTLRARPSSSPRQGGVQHLVPGDPSSAAVCRYADYQLSRSARLTPQDTSALTHILNSLQAGISQPGPGFAEAAPECAQDLRRGFIVQFSYPTGPPLAVYVHIGGCADLSASNGMRTVKLSQALVTALTTAAGYDAGFPDPSELR